MINNSTYINKRITYHLNSLNTNKTTTHDVGIPGPGLGQAHKYGGVKPVNANISINSNVFVSFTCLHKLFTFQPFSQKSRNQ
jgi:hypothetical protein